MQQMNFQGCLRHNLKDQGIPQKSKSKGKYFTSGDRVVPQGVTHQQCGIFQSTEPNTNSPYQKLLYSQVKNNQSGKIDSTAEKVLRYNNCVEVSQFDSNDQQGQNLIKNNDLFNKIQINKPKQSYKKLILSLDAPGIVDEFRIQPIDWSSQDYIILAAKTQLHAYHFYRKQVINLANGINETDKQFTSVKWNHLLPQLLATGNKNGQLELWDFENIKKIQQLKVSNQQINWISFSQNIIACACQNTKINIYDSRQSNSIQQLNGHSDSVLGVRFQNENFSCGPYLASGGADKQVIVWDLRNQNKLIHNLSGHQGVVKALDWNPRRSNIIVSGGGSDDLNSIIQWDNNTGKKIQTIPCNSQITSLVFGSIEGGELYSGHGYNQNSLIVWKAKNPLKYELEYEILEHKSRILALAIDSSGEKLCSLECNEVMKFWDLNIDSRNKQLRYKIDYSHEQFR